MTGSRSRARAFSLVEMLLVILVVFMLMGLLLGGFRFARNYAKRQADRTSVKSLQQAVSYFSQQMGFVPPLIKDFGDPPAFGGSPIKLVNNENRPNTYTASVPTDLDFLRTTPNPAQPDLRFSIYSFSYYLLGACDEDRLTGAVPPAQQMSIDGVRGPGMFAVKRDGTFERSGKRFEPFFDTSRNAKAVVTDTITGGPGRIELRDSNNVAFRYYRWEHGAPGTGQVVDAADLNVPVMLGLGRVPAPNPMDVRQWIKDIARAMPEVKSAKFAIVAAGPNGLFGNEDQLPPNHPQALSLSQMAAKLGISDSDPDRVAQLAAEDNVVEVGK
jgi:type II secretory pathway pseudopilin PulG